MSVIRFSFKMTLLILYNVLYDFPRNDIAKLVRFGLELKPGLDMVTVHTPHLL